MVKKKKKEDIYYIAVSDTKTNRMLGFVDGYTIPEVLENAKLYGKPLGKIFRRLE